ncbi:solute carrier family 25 member 46 [Orussus abietinus]|uniref:solute carrier family 25 member 46 n=1 Tax=Orussus abietinus TaxID=222816 RepID=UPI000626E17C|nr:solute carrier family 25 member 46 [Orussus abietinus]
MAGLAGYQKVYRGRQMEEEIGAGVPNKYYGREVIRPLDIPVIHPLAEDSPPADADDFLVKKYIGMGCGLASLITENLLIHPFIILRRQCQVNPTAQRYHLVPITLIPVMIRLHQSQGLSTLWKGIGSVLLVRGLTLAVEDLVSKITFWPKEISWNSRLKAFGQHVLLKCVSIGIVMPFYSASLVETVQSEIVSERPGILDVFRDGAMRAIEISNRGTLLPIYILLPPTVAYGVAKYLFSLPIRSLTSRIMHIRHKHSQELRGAYSRDLVSESVVQDIELQSTLISMYTADIVFYPFETVIQRLHLQGTRTIIDDLDSGRSVTPLMMHCTGAVDCYRKIISSEGLFGLYKGFGALGLQFIVHVLVLKATKWILIELTNMLRPRPKTKKTAAIPPYCPEL